MVLEREKFKINWQIWCLIRAGFLVHTSCFCCAHMEKRARKLPVASFIRALTPFLGALPSWHYNLPKILPPNTITLWVRCQLRTPGGTQTFSWLQPHQKESSASHSSFLLSLGALEWIDNLRVTLKLMCISQWCKSSLPPIELSGTPPSASDVNVS